MAERQLPFFINLITTQRGRIDLSSRRRSTYGDTVEYKAYPPVTSFFSLFTAPMKPYWIKNIPERDGITDEISSDNSNLEGLDTSGVVFIRSQVDMDNNVIHGGGALRKLLDVMDKGNELLLKDMALLRSENAQLRAENLRLSKGGLEMIEVSAKGSERLLNIRNAADKDKTRQRMPNLSDGIEN